MQHPTRSALLVLIALVGLAAQAAPTSRGFLRLYEGVERPEREVVYLQPGEVLQLSKRDRRNILTAIPSGPWPATKLVSLDGVAIPGDGSGAVELLPGRHTLVVAMQSIHGGELWEIDKDWVANTIYQSVAVNTKRGFEVDIQCGELWAPIESGPEKGKTKPAVMQCGIDHGTRKLEQAPATRYELIEIVGSNARIYDGAPRPPTELSLLNPSSSFEEAVLLSSYTEGAGVGSSQKLLSTIPRVYLVAVDGRSVFGAGNSALEIEAGKHLLKVRLVAPKGTNKLFEFEVETKAGVSYEIFCEDGETQWDVVFKPRARWVRD
jgi:hypothetical protein